MILKIDLMTAREEAAHRIFRTGSFKIDIKEGFKIALHDKLPDAPLSPFYLNLRPKGTKGGTLTQADIDVIGCAMVLKGHEAELFTQLRPICSIPAAGDPFLDSMLAFLQGEGIELKRFRLEKMDVSGKRAFRLAPEDLAVWKDVLLIDDLVTSTQTKGLALEPIIKMRGTVPDLLVFLNRSTTAAFELKQMGIRLHTVWEFENLMEWALGKAYLNRIQYETIMDYPAILEVYKEKTTASA